MDGRIHVLGGEPDAAMLQAHEAFDIDSGIWWVGPRLPTGRHGLGVASLGGSIYAIGGGPVAGFAQTNVVEIFIPF